MPMRGELPTISARSRARPSAAQTAWSRLYATISNPDLQAVVGFCTIGLLIAINLILRFPDFGEYYTTLATFP
jgi:hypothetical protein